MERRRIPWLSALWLVGAAALLLAAFAHPAAAQAQPVRVLSVGGVIDPLVAQYVERGLARTDARLYVVLLDTPGGTDIATRRIVQAILGSRVPVVVYVAPQGARAGSAGMFITLAGHVAAMAPGTNIGASHPVGAGGEDVGGNMDTKVTNDAAALARSIAEMRGRNADWAEKAVRESASITAQEALSQRVVDLVAEDLDDLLRQLEGRKVAAGAGEAVLELAGAPREKVPMTPFEQILHILVEPNIAYMLLSLGTLGVTLEFYHPGTIIPGTFGVICLILAFIAFGSLPLNWGGVALIALAIIFFILDIKVTGFALSVAGAVAFVLGSLILFSPFTPRSPTMPLMRVNPALIATMTAALTGFFVFAVTAGLRAQRLRVPVGVHTLVGARGVAVSDLDPLGIVQLRGEQWTAVARRPPIAAGEPVRVLRVEGNKLIVRRG